MSHAAYLLDNGALDLNNPDEKGDNNDKKNRGEGRKIRK